MIGTIVNAAAVLVGGLLGLLLRGGIPQRLRDTVMQGLGLCVLIIGMRGAVATSDVMVLIVSIVAGGLLGEWINIEAHLAHMGERMEKRFTHTDAPEGQFAQAFMTASLMFCVGALAVVGPMDSGLRGDNTTLFVKAALDFVTALFFASAMGPGVLLGAVTVLCYQGAIALCARAIAPWMTEGVVAEMGAVGGLLILAIGMNMLGITKVRVGNLLPAMFVPMLYLPLMGLFS
ncbi:MAG: DUF554 domain-containing protein [Clostridia bacterium]